MKKQVDIFLENAAVLTMDSDRKLIFDGAVAVKGKDIIDIGDTLDLKEKYTAQRRINGKNKLVMPGLINAHTHISGVLSRGMINDLSLIPWIQKKFYVSSRALDEENYYVSALLLCLEMIKTGTTCFVDCGTVQGLEDIAVSAIKKIGMKAVLGRMLMDVPDILASSHKRREVATEENLVHGEEFIKKWDNAADGRIKAWLCPVQVCSVSDKLWVKSAELARKHGVGILTHASVVAEEAEMCVAQYGFTPIERLNRLGVLAPNFCATHMGWITEQEMLLLRDTQASIIHCPSASMKCALGSLSRGKFPELIAIGANVGLGSDGASASSFQDMVRVMYLVAGGHKEVRLDPRVIPPEKAVELATVNNARALLWSDRIGSLERGKRADIIMFDLMRPEWVPWNEKNLVSNLVYSASGSSVDMVMIDGEIIVEAGVVKTVDERQILEKAQEASKKFSALSDEWDKGRGRQMV